MGSSGLKKVFTFLKAAKGFERVLSNIKIISAGNGSCVSEMDILPEHCNVLKTMHGGLAATLVDVLSCCALYTHEKWQQIYVSLNLNVNFMKGAAVGDTILIEADTLKVTKSLAFLTVNIKDKLSGASLVKGTQTMYLIPDIKVPGI